MDDFLNFQGQEGAAEPFDWERELKRASLRYNGRGEGEIVKEIFARAAAAKKDGTLTNDGIDAFYRQFSAVLDAPRRRKLEKLVNRLKEM